MTVYWCKLFDVSGHVAGAEKLVCRDDADAIAKAQIAYAAYREYEIWDGTRQVHRPTREIRV
jgi:hypothetical protein